jgi:hypothetical protein
MKAAAGQWDVRWCMCVCEMAEKKERRRQAINTTAAVGCKKLNQSERLATKWRNSTSRRNQVGERQSQVVMRAVCVCVYAIFLPSSKCPSSRAIVQSKKVAKSVVVGRSRSRRLLLLRPSTKTTYIEWLHKKGIVERIVVVVVSESRKPVHQIWSVRFLQNSLVRVFFGFLRDRPSFLPSFRIRTKLGRYYMYCILESLQIYHHQNTREDGLVCRQLQARPSASECREEAHR